MDARDRLRRYLEQRRELGESEFVLDGLPVEDVLSLVGVKSAPRGRGARSAPSVAAGGQPDGTVSGGPAERPQEPRASVVPPPSPAQRFDARGSTDWREALRSAGVRGEGESSIPSTAAPIDATIADTIASLPTLDAVAAHIASCARCALCRTATRSVPGEGEVTADFLCVGEAPGADEDREGRPFVGAAGEILRKGLEGLKLTPADVFIANVIKHRPPGNRDPLPEEIAACQPYLSRQIALVRPRVILALGRIAAQMLLRTTRGIGSLRGSVHAYEGIPLIVTYHPAATLRNAEWKRPLWEDMKLAHRLLLEQRAAGSGAE